MEFRLIMVFVDHNKTDQVIDASRAAGATGATIITGARGIGLEKAIGIFGLELLNIRNVIFILVEKRRADGILKAVVEAGGLDESLGTGIVLEIDVARALGLSEHIKKLEDQLPIGSHA